MRKGMLKGAQMSSLFGQGHALWARGCGGQYPEALRVLFLLNRRSPRQLGCWERALSLETEFKYQPSAVSPHDLGPAQPQFLLSVKGTRVPSSKGFCKGQMRKSVSAWYTQQGCQQWTPTSAGTSSLSSRLWPV